MNDEPGLDLYRALIYLRFIYFCLLIAHLLLATMYKFMYNFINKFMYKLIYKFMYKFTWDPARAQGLSRSCWALVPALAGPWPSSR